ncbi:MAG: hypothetical protein AB1782_10760 [Cyanobacteriota bacterium]
MKKTDVENFLSLVKQDFCIAIFFSNSNDDYVEVNAEAKKTVTDTALLIEDKVHDYNEYYLFDLQTIVSLRTNY